MYLPIVATSNLFYLLENKSACLCVEQEFHAASVILDTSNPPKHRDVYWRQIYNAGSNWQSTFHRHWKNLYNDMIAHEPSCYLHVLQTLPKQMSMLHWQAIAVAKASIHHDISIQMEVTFSRPDQLPTLSAAKTFVHSLLFKSPF